MRDTSYLQARHDQNIADCIRRKARITSPLWMKFLVRLREHPRLAGVSVHLLRSLGSLWIGAHYSARYRRWCINPVPCFTICIVLAGGTAPGEKYEETREK